MYEGKSSALFRRYAMPQMVGLLFNSVYFIVDGVFIGNRLGREAMAAASIAVPVIEVLLALSMGLASGGGARISAALGQGDETAARRAFVSVAVLALGIAAVVALAGNALLHPLVQLLGATPEVHGSAAAYLWYIVTFSPFLLFSGLLGGFARSDGQPVLAMVALATGSCMNIVLDWLFMYPLNMGIAGAALATALGPVISVGILLPHFLARRGSLYFAGGGSAREAIGAAVVGIPAFVMEFSIGMVTLCYNLAIRACGYGELGLAAYLIIGYLMLIFLTVFLGWSEGLQPLFAYFSGAREEVRLAGLLRFSRRVYLCAGIAICALIALFSRYFYMLFASGDEELVAFAAQRSALYFCGFFLAGYNLLMITCWQARQRMGRSLFAALLRGAVLPALFAFALPPLLGREVLWACHSLAEAVTAAAILLLAHNSRPGRPALSHRPG